MSTINYKKPVVETCEATTGQGYTCMKPAKHEIDGKHLCGVHGGPILRRREKMGKELLDMELWSRGAYSQQAKQMTDGELRERLGEIENIVPARFSGMTEAQAANLRAELHELKRELSLR